MRANITVNTFNEKGEILRRLHIDDFNLIGEAALNRFNEKIELIEKTLKENKKPFKTCKYVKFILFDRSVGKYFTTTKKIVESAIYDCCGNIVEIELKY